MRTLLLRLLAVAAVVLAAAGCGYGGGERKVCDAHPSAPVVSADTGMIEGAAEAACDVQPISHVMHVGIEREADAGGWDLVLTGGDLYAQCFELPGPGVVVRCAWHIPCVDGHYRTTVTVTGEGQLGSFSFTAPERPASLITCTGKP